MFKILLSMIEYLNKEKKPRLTQDFLQQVSMRS